MARIRFFIEKHPDLFRYISAAKVLPHDEFLAKTVLRFLPASVTPNRLTMFRIFATPVVFWLILSEHYRIGIIAFLLTALTDAMDGSLARMKNQITKFGILFDPLADKLLIGSLVILLVFRYYPIWMGVVILGLEIIFIILAVIAQVHLKIIRMANMWGKAKMILQVMAVFLTLSGLLLDVPYFFTAAAWVFGVAIGFAVVSLFAHGV